jgi:hypothetical protein
MAVGSRQQQSAVGRKRGIFNISFLIFHCVHEQEVNTADESQMRNEKWKMPLLL